MKHYVLSGTLEVTRPALLFEIKIDLQDVRSGYRTTDIGVFKGEWISEPELQWTQDMVVSVPEETLVEIDPPRDPGWPESADNKIISYLLRFYRPQVWRNSELRLFSTPAESRDDFQQRCREQVFNDRSDEMARLHKLWIHRFYELEARVGREILSDELDNDMRSRVQAQSGALFSDIREDLSRWFLRDQYRLIRPEETQWRLESFPDVDDRLQDMKINLVNAYNEISRRFEETAMAIEPYEVGLTQPAIEIARRAICWE